MHLEVVSRKFLLGSEVLLAIFTGIAGMDLPVMLFPLHLTVKRFTAFFTPILVFRFLDRIVVKGRSQPVPVYEIVGLKESVSPTVSDCIRIFDLGMAAYLAKDWGTALAAFRQSALAEPNQPGESPGVETNPSLVMIGRCEEMKLHPPGENWDGVYVMKAK